MSRKGQNPLKYIKYTVEPKRDKDINYSVEVETGTGEKSKINMNTSFFNTDLQNCIKTVTAIVAKMLNIDRIKRKLKLAICTR